MMIFPEDKKFLNKVALALEYALKESLGENMKAITPRDVESVAVLKTLQQELQ